MDSRKVKVAVIGGGMTGQLVQLAIPRAELFDWQDERKGGPKLVRNMGANYLWEPIPGTTCREFLVVTHVDGKEPTIEAVTRYKDKIGKSGDVAGWERQFKGRMPGFDFVTMPTPRILYQHRVEWVDKRTHTIFFANAKTPVVYDYLVSTIPLYALLSMVQMREPPGRLQHKPIYFKVISRPPDAPYPSDILYVNYISNPDVAPYRFCDRFGERHFESITPFESPTPARRFAPGKILPHAGVSAVLEELASFNIYTFGRYGSWNSDELVHETYKRIVDWKETLEL